MKDTNKKEYRIPMEVTDETIRDYGIDPEEVVFAKIGRCTVRAILVPATKEQYLEYMRPLWREEKRNERSSKNGRELSLDELKENVNFDVPDDIDIEDDYIKNVLFQELHKVLDELEEIDRTIMLMLSENKSDREIGRTIGMTHKAVGKRKKKCFELLFSKLKGFGK